MLSFWMFTAVISLPLPDELVRVSVDNGIHRLEAAATSYVKNRSCFSCHHQAVPMLALATAKEHGFVVDEKVLAKQEQFTIDFFVPKIKDLTEGRNLGGGNTTAVYGLFTLDAGKHKADETTKALVEFLLKKQQKDGSWIASSNRPPSQGSLFTTGALALEALNEYGAEDDDRVIAAIEKGLRFLRDTRPKTTEDRVFQLRGLVAGKATAEEIAKAKDDLLSRQRANGGWAQLDELETDAYATGSVMVALRLAGLSAENDAYRRGVRYLYFTQHESGGWIVTTRARPVQTYFDNGDPGGKSQFISTAATGWAVAALSELFRRDAKDRAER